MYCDGVNTSPSANPLVVVSLVLWLLMLLSLLGTTAEFFFTEQLDYASRRLGLSDDVAGATFMAAGSSAPELAVAVVSTLLASEPGRVRVRVRLGLG